MLKCYYKGDDIKLNIKIKDEAGEYLDLTEYQDIHVRIVIPETTFMFKASTDLTKPIPEYSPIDLYDAYTATFTIPSEITWDTMPLGFATMGINLVKSDGVLPDGFNKNIEI